MELGMARRHIPAPLGGEQAAERIISSAGAIPLPPLPELRDILSSAPFESFSIFQLHTTTTPLNLNHNHPITNEQSTTINHVRFFYNNN